MQEQFNQFRSRFLDIIEQCSIIQRFLVQYLKIVQIHNYGREPILRNSNSSIEEIGMNRNMFGLGERLRSTRKGFFRVFSSIRAIGLGDLYTSSDAKEEPIRLRSARAFVIENRRKHEVETQKAMLTSLSRHDRWKAGGPV